MKSSVRISSGILLVLVVSLIGCDAERRLRLIRRITASDLPTTLNQTNPTDTNTTQPNLVNNTEVLVTNVLASNQKISEDFDNKADSPSQANITEIRKTSIVTSRRQKPVTVAPNVTSTTPPSDTNSTPSSVRRPYLRTDRTNVIRSKKSGNCDSESGDTNCEQKIAANEIKPVLELPIINATKDAKTEDTKKKPSKEKLHETSTDRTFSNIVSSSTARIVMQENIHTDILRHLTTVSYAHYETDYVMEDDPYEAESHVSPNQASTNNYEEYAKQGEHSNYNVTYTTPSSKLFDEAFARVSEGIRQNLDDIEEKSEEYEHFSSSSDDEASVSSEGLPKNDSKVSLQFLNHVNVISNDSASANSRHGDLLIDNGTHVQLERSFLQTKVTPEISSTVKYLIDDEYSTTRRITTEKDDEDNSIKESIGSPSEHIDQEGAEDGRVVAKLERRDRTEEDDTRTAPKENNITNNTLTIAVKTEALVSPLKNETAPVPVEEYELHSPSETSVKSTNQTSSHNFYSTTIKTNANTRGRMYSSAEDPTYNTNNTVEEGVTGKADGKRVRGKLSPQNTSTTDATESTRSRMYSSRRAPITPTTSGRYESSSNETWVTSPRTNIIRSRRPITTTSRPESNTQNNEGNDILVNENYRLPNRRGAVRFGNLKNAEQSEQFSIPSTASAWSLITMKEPSRRTRLSSTQTTTPFDDQGDSEASGSFSSGTTVYNSLAPSSFANSTRPSKYVDSNSVQNKVSVTTESMITFTKSKDEIGTTQYPDMDITSTQSSFMESEDSFTTQQPYETTAMMSQEDVADISGDDDERFEISRRTTLSPISGVDIQVTTPNDDSFPTTTEVYGTTRMPKELGDKVVEEENEDEDAETVSTTPEPVVSELETGIAEEGQGILGNNQGDATLDSHQVNKDAETGLKMNEGKDRTQEEKHGTKDIEIRPTMHEGVGQKEEGSGRMHVEGHNPEDVQSVVEEDSDYGGPSGAEAETEAPNTVGGITNKKIDAGNVTTATNATTQPVDTSTLTPARENSTSTVDPSTTIQEISDIHTFIRLFVEAPMREFCELIPQFKKAVADRLTEGTGRSITDKQVILRNIGSDQCSNFRDTNTTNEGELIPVEMHIIDETGVYDQQLNDAFPLLWGHLDLDFPLRIRKVDVIDESLAYAVNSGNGAVIAAITISCIAAVCLLILAVLLVVMRKRQKKVNYGMRCTPVSLDAYSLDSVSVHGSVRRKGGVRASKRSYGNPAFDDPTSPTNSMNFASLANFVNNRDAVEEEFGNIPHVTPKCDELPEGAETKNRYANVIPLPETRVVLTVQGEEQLSDYINANYVSGPKNAARFYIACQAPMQSTVNDFWRMIWEKQSKVIIMLTDLVENGVEKCADYLPPSEVLDCHRLFGDYQVTLKKREVRETYVISTLQLKNMESNSWREVVHLWYLEWPSQGVPEEPSSVIALLIEARAYMKPSSGGGGGGGGPCVVHCSPGTGRTGTVLACDLCIRDFEQTRLVDLPRCVARLRKDRAGCVQTRDQYAFIYQVLNLYATKLTGGALDESI